MKNKVLGGMYGLALGDAWAMPAMYTPQQTWDLFGGWFTDFYPGPEMHQFHHGMHPARITDDTEQAYALAEEIIREGKVTAEGAARAIVSWYDRIDGDNSPYVGPSTRRAVMAMKRGVNLSETGRFGDTNGASMRIAPVGLINPGNLAAVVRDTHQACIPTHNTSVAVSGAAAVAGAVAMALMPGVSLEDVVRAGMQAADMGRELSEPWIGASVARRIAIAADIAASDRPERERIQEIYDVVGATLAITESVPAAFGMLVMGQGDPMKTVTYAAALSGDADTVSAMAGAIAGAFSGIEAIPDWVVRKLKEANPEVNLDWAAGELYRLAEKSTVSD